ncbi:metal ABC transporter ATP-binding protein [Clostridium vincentii]|uniref:Zinc import ATP-binding protein ZnuC n=1 Tax=Clostridium vincentii TaxID=52704 RepID=A0A2T0BFI8_9CLOT|nr:metal ABC transporter ATP-binding protein [Clostridium vincentii]PRR82628.1 Zinc import ATP-binding protein ZnuC [Clostridium vincentii]
MINSRTIDCNENCESNNSLSSIIIKDLGVTLGKSQILKDINISIKCGELLALIGTNGAGKSTLLKALLGEIAYSGAISFIDANNKLSKKPVIGYVPQKLDFDYSSPISVLDIFSALLRDRPVFFPRNKQMKKRVEECLNRVKATDLIDRQLGVLSGGELQRVLLALALEPMPDILLLDEPVSGIDQNGLKLFYETVLDLRKNNNLAIILVSHDLKIVKEKADKIAFINNKTIECLGTVEEIFNNTKVIEVFGRVCDC